jgi:hypothetical protein
MRFSRLTILMGSLIALTNSDPASAQRRHIGPTGIQDRYCLQGRSWGYPGNCQFSTYRQCMATASGTFATCGINPAYAYGQQPQYGDPYGAYGYGGPSITFGVGGGRGW